LSATGLESAGDRHYSSWRGDEAKGAKGEKGGGVGGGSTKQFRATRTFILV